MSVPTHPFRSKNLIYTAIESPDHDALFQAIQSEPSDFIGSNAHLITPQSRADAAAYQKDVLEKHLLGVVICIPPPFCSPESPATPIGTIHLKDLSPNMKHHRFTEIGIDIVKGHQGKGYGSEAIRWCLEWAFLHAGLHRVIIRAFEWNTGARRLYERLGFRPEGVIKEELWMNGRWWDGYLYGMLDWEWREMQEKDRTVAKEGS